MEEVVSKGFLVLAQNTESVNYIEQAYALALSIKATQNLVTELSLVTNDSVPSKYRAVFDKIIPIPFGDTANISRFRAENRWKLYHASPYHETIVLDTDMLMLEDISTWWDYCSNYNLRFCSRIKNYKHEVVTDIVHRKAFTLNNLSNPYVALHYFKKSPESLEFYKVLEFVVNNWEWCWTKFAPENYQNWLSMDLAIAVAIEITGSHEEVLDVLNPMEFIHMKPLLQNWNDSIESWQDRVSYNFDNKELTVGNIKQYKLFHYIENDFLSPQIVKRLEEIVNG
jgi:hypothetical protein